MNNTSQILAARAALLANAGTSRATEHKTHHQHTACPFASPRDEFGALIAPIKLNKQLSLVLQTCSKIRKKKDATHCMSELAGPIKRRCMSAGVSNHLAINYVCAWAYDVISKDWGILEVEVIAICKALETALAARMNTPNDTVVTHTELTKPHTNSEIEFRIKSIGELFKAQTNIDYASYLRGLYVAQGKTEQAKAVLLECGKKRYEEFMRQAAVDLSNQLTNTTTKPQHDFLVACLSPPFRRSAVKDLEEVELSSKRAKAAIQNYRYQFVNVQYLVYIDTIGCAIPDSEAIPTPLAALLLDEALALVADAKADGIEPENGDTVAIRSMWNRPKTQRLYEVVRTIVEGALYSRRNTTESHYNYS